MNTDHLLQTAVIRTGSGARTKDDVLHELAALAAQSSMLGSSTEQDVFTALQEREAVSTTGFGNGIAIPHCALEGLGDFIVGILTSPEGAAFDAMDKKPVTVFVLIIAPAERRTEHIKVLSAVSRVLNDAGTVKKLSAAADADTVRHIFGTALAPSDAAPVHTAHARLDVAVQDRERFDAVMQLLSEQDDCSVSVIETHDARDYLSSMPLFASFWNTSEKGFQRLIIAVMPKGHANDVIRRINLLQEDGPGEGMLVTLTELAYAGGSLLL